MTSSKEIDRQEAMPDCPECEHNVFVHAGTQREWVCEGCSHQWGSLKGKTDSRTTIVAKLLRTEVREHGSPTYVRAKQWTDTLDMRAQEIGRLLAVVDVEDLELTQHTPSGARAARWKVTEVDDGE